MWTDEGRELGSISGLWRSGKEGPDGVPTISPLLSIMGLSETTPGSRPAYRASPTSGCAISGSGLGAPPDLSRIVSTLLVDSERPARERDRRLERENGLCLV